MKQHDIGNISIEDLKNFAAVISNDHKNTKNISESDNDISTPIIKTHRQNEETIDTDVEHILKTVDTNNTGKLNTTIINIVGIGVPKPTLYLSATLIAVGVSMWIMLLNKNKTDKQTKKHTKTEDDDN